MSQAPSKTFLVIIFILFVVGISFFVAFQYSEKKFNDVAFNIEDVNNKHKATEQDLEAKIKNLEGLIQGTVTNLSQEQQTNNALKSQFNEINNTVGVLKKLSATDPELLKKYSKIYFLNEHYVPISLTDVEQDYRGDKSVNYKIESDVWPHLRALIDAGNTDGVGVRVQSAFRSFSTQAILKNNYKMTYGAGTANSFSADQGYSEHQLGTAVDFTTAKTKGALEGFDQTPEFKWLNDNAYKYGFVISYPKGNKYYKYEPWHWRFVGVALATKLHDDGVYFYDMDQRVIDTYLANIFD